MREHGRQSYRDEACGVIYGRSDDELKEVLDVQPLANSRDRHRHRRFLITSTDYRRAEARAYSQGMELLGFFHSHPDHPACPSAYDLEHAVPFFSYVIVSVSGGEPGEVRSFVMKEDRTAFAEEEMLID